MDGNYYLIKLVKKHPILWDKTCQETRDSDARNTAWKEIAGIIGVEMNWIRSRWYNLRERFVKELKQSYYEKQKSKFKYFNDMLFLVKHVEFRKKPDSQFDTFVEQLPHKHKQSQQNQLAEFVITRKQIEENDDVDPDQVFMELEECEESLTVVEEKTINADDNETQLYIQEVSDSISSQEKYDCIEADNVEKIVEIPVEKVDSPPELIQEYEETSTTVQKQECNSSPAESRCEDVIFGELVAAMLKKMDETKKKTAKKEIINILLS